MTHSRHAFQGEGPAIFKPSDGNYYMMASHLTFWRPNPAMLFHAAADSLATAKWSQLARPAMGPGANTTYNSQSSSVFALESGAVRLANGAALHIYMGDRWNFYGPGSVRLSPSSDTAVDQHDGLLASNEAPTSNAALDCSDARCLGGGKACGHRESTQAAGLPAEHRWLRRWRTARMCGCHCCRGKTAWDILYWSWRSGGHGTTRRRCLLLHT